MRLIDRWAEKQALQAVLDSVRAGMSAALVLRGEPGIGKTALIDHTVQQAHDLHVVRMVAVESESAMGFAALHQLVTPFLAGIARLPEPQRRSLDVAFGLVGGPPADAFLVGLAVLTLLSDAAGDRPVMWIVDDAQWLDNESADVLSFLARRLLADRVGLLFAIRETTEPDRHLQAVPELRIDGLPEQEAFELLRTAVDDPVDADVAKRIVSGTGGNPLALIEVGADLTTEQLRGQVPLPEPLPVGHELEDLYARRIRGLPAETRMLLLLVAADQPARGDRLWQAAAALGIPESAAVPAEASRLAVFGPEARFPHPLVRSAAYHATTAVQRRQAHRALAAASDPEVDATSRAWHLAAAATGMDESVAAQLEAAANRSKSRGGYAATAVLLERAAMLTPDEERKGKRQLAAAQAHLLAGGVNRAEARLAEAIPMLHHPASSAQATRLAGNISFHRGLVGDAASTLVRAARQLRPLDPRAARDTLLSAVEATVYAGWAPSTSTLEEIARTASALSPTGDPPDSAASLLLQGWTERVTGGYVAAVPTLRRALQACLADELDPEVALQHLHLAALAAVDLQDDVSLEQVTTRWVDRARQAGALARLAAALAFRGALVEGPRGRLAEARATAVEAHELAEVTGNPGVVPPSGAHTLITLALSGSEAEARATAVVVNQEAPSRGAVGEVALAAYFLGLLEISLGNYGAALECLRPAYSDDTPLVGTQVLPELVEAAVRAGRRDLADSALRRLADRANATGTPLAMGLLGRSRALLADQRAARGKYEEAIDLLSQARTPPQLARTHLLYGEWLRRERRRREARDQLRTALDMFDGMGLRCFARRARVELRATGEHARAGGVGTPEQLTPQEAQVAAMASRGDANREIAAQLFLSPATVEYHLRKVFRKLGVTSRTQLAHRVFNQGAGLLRPIPDAENPSHA